MESATTGSVLEIPPGSYFSWTRERRRPVCLGGTHLHYGNLGIVCSQCNDVFRSLSGKATVHSGGELEFFVSDESRGDVPGSGTV